MTLADFALSGNITGNITIEFSSSFMTLTNFTLSGNITIEFIPEI